MKVSVRVAAVLFALVAVFLGVRFAYRESGLRALLLSRGDKPAGGVLERALFFPAFGGPDHGLARLHVSLTELSRGLREPTSLAFLPAPFGSPLVTERAGHVVRIEGEGVLVRWLDLEVLHEDPAQGLLGIAVHPQFATNGRLFLAYTPQRGAITALQVDEFRVPDPARSIEETPSHVKQILTIDLPYGGQAGGALAFGSDQKLYVGIGDGGATGDPEGHGQNPRTWLGSVLRIDVDVSGDAPYAVPKDNPFASHPDIGAPEVFAFGLRHPRRLSLDAEGRLLVVDDSERGSDEVSIVKAADNLGWALMEGRECFRPGCKNEGLKKPFVSVEPELAGQLVGGAIGTSLGTPTLRGLYVFGDASSGRLFAVAVPKDPEHQSALITLGAWPISPSAIGRAPDGRLLVVDPARGRVYRIDPGRPHYTDGMRDLFDFVDDLLSL